MRAELPPHFRRLGEEEEEESSPMFYDGEVRWQKEREHFYYNRSRGHTWAHKEKRSAIDLSGTTVDWLRPPMNTATISPVCVCK